MSHWESPARERTLVAEPAQRFHEGSRPEPAASGGDISINDVRETYGRFAPAYDIVFGALLKPGRVAMAKAVSQLRCSSILEVGVGTGLTLPDYPAQAQVVGIDVSERMLAVARRRADAMTSRDISLYLMSAEQMDFDDASFDCVTVPYVLSVTPNPARLIHEIRRVCRRDGVIVVLNHFSGSAVWRPWERALRTMARSTGFRSELSFEEHILGHDWTLEAVRPVNLFGLSRLAVLRNGAVTTSQESGDSSR